MRLRMVKMSKVALIGNTLNTMGGGERVTATMLLALKEMGFKTTLLTWDKPAWPLISRQFDEFTKLSGAVDSVSPLSVDFKELTAIGSFDAVLALTKVPKLVKGYDLIVNSQGNTVAFPADISYVHFPTFALLRPELREVAKHHLHVYVSSSGDMILLKLRYWLYKTTLEHSALVLANSRFTGSLLERVIDANVRVLYPPVQVEKIRSLVKLGERKDVVVTISHFRRDKNLEIIPFIASKVEAKFIVIGHAHDISYVRDLRRLIKRLGVRDKVILLFDLPRKNLLELLAKAKMYLHTMIAEHFGMSVVEGMAAGLVPIVHRSGGPWIDILDEKQGLYGYGYIDVEEAISVINELLSNEGCRDRVSRRIQRRALIFDEENFKAKFKAIIQNFMK